MGFLSKLFNKEDKKPEPEPIDRRYQTINSHYSQSTQRRIRQKAFEIPKGNRKIKVHGTFYTQDKLKESEDIVLCLTLKNQYQKEHEWPEGECVNVNKINSKITTQDNWLGYVYYKYAGKLLAEVRKHNEVRVHARIRKVIDTLEMELLVTEDYIV